MNLAIFSRTTTFRTAGFAVLLLFAVPARAGQIMIDDFTEPATAVEYKSTNTGGQDQG